MNVEEAKKLIKGALESIAPTLPQILKFHLERKLGENLTEILLTNPRAIYDALLEINSNLEDQTDSLIMELVSAISGKCGIDLDPQEVLTALKENNRQKIEQLIRHIIISSKAQNVTMKKQKILN
ncbi:MAG: hypothetical protein DRJ52_04490 [Thermoprotei archaeon]|nr:MAG: hypothetical protein DRJ52_04490 [Thermoprotei archaeon]